jgi:hypothetical protein
MTDRKAGFARRADHRCSELMDASECLMVLDIGPSPRFVRDAQDAGRTVELEGGLDVAWGTAERAEVAWRHHKGELATYARSNLARAAEAGRVEVAEPPLAHRVFEPPGAPWPPPLHPAPRRPS